MNMINRAKILKEVWSLTPCSPLIKAKDLINASKLLKKNKKKKKKKKKIILPVSEYPAPLEWAFKIKKNKNLIPMKKIFIKLDHKIYLNIILILVTLWQYQFIILRRKI